MDSVNTRAARVAAAVAVLAAASACATHPGGAPAIPVPEGVPAALQAPVGQEPFLQVHAVGVQVYECAAKADAPGGWAWQFRGPEATLADAAGKTVGRHFGGPSWASNDGATVVGQVSASAPAPDKGDIPWLLLSIKSREGEGLLAPTASVQRLATQGGVAPAAACSAASAKQLERVAYTATYVFWRVKAG
jgi:hypothetical protein